MDEEPLEDWLRRRDADRLPPGTRKALPLGAGPAQAAHVDPDEPRLLLEWDGQQWNADSVAVDRATATQATDPGAAARAVRLPQFNALPAAVPPWRPPPITINRGP